MNGLYHVKPTAYIQTRHKATGRRILVEIAFAIELPSGTGKAENFTAGNAV